MNHQTESPDSPGGVISSAWSPNRAAAYAAWCVPTGKVTKQRKSGTGGAGEVHLTRSPRADLREAGASAGFDVVPPAVLSLKT